MLLNFFILLLGWVPHLETGDRPLRVFIFGSHDMHIPFLVAEKELPRTTEVRLFVSADRGKTWVLEGKAAAAKDGAFPFQAPRDGEYWFQLQVITRDGKAVPENVSKHPPRLRVLVRTKK